MDGQFLKLDRVSLVITEGRDANRIIKSALDSTRNILFKKVILFAPTFPEQLKDIVTEYHQFSWDYNEWNRFMLKDLTNFIDTEFIINIHEDGYILNPDAWIDEFYNYDFIGARWKWDNLVGNGGFSFRSKKYLDVTSKSDITAYVPEDDIMLRHNLSYLLEKGIKIAPPEIADQFSLEGGEYDGQFGFHNYAITSLTKRKDKKIKVNFLISVYDKEHYVPYLLKIIRSFIHIEPEITIVYNGKDDKFVCDARLENLGHSVGHFPQIKKGFEIIREKKFSSLVVNLCADSWLLDEDKIISIFRKMNLESKPYAGNYWFDDGTKSSLATEVFFADLSLGDFIKDWNRGHESIEQSLFSHNIKNNFKYLILDEREPVHPNFRFESYGLRLVAYHSLEENLNKLKEWGYESKI